MLFRFLIAATLTAGCALAQISSFPKPSYFRETFQKTQTKVELQNPAHLKDFVADGKLELSLKNYLALVMANNTDVQLQLISLEIPKNNILQQYGLWDPKATASFSATRSTTVPTNATTAANAAALTKSLNQPYSLAYTQTLPEGLQYTAQFSGAKTSATNSFNNYNPALTSNLRMSITQPLIQNRGSYVNRIPLMVAQVSYKISQFQQTQQLLSLINTAETAYWNVVSARENLKVAESGRTNADEFLKYMQKQLDLGALSPLDIYNPQQSLAAADLTVSQARFNLAQAEDSLRHQMGADLDPDIRKLPINLTETVDLGPADSLPPDTEQEVSKALMTHPAIRQATQKLDSDDLGIQSAKNGLLPNLSLSMSYQSNGTGGVYDTSRSTLLGGGPNVIIPGGITDALGQMFGFGYPTYFASLNLTLPIRNRAASAAMATALVQKKSDSLTLRNQQQAIRLNILTALTRLEGAKEQLKLAKVQLDFAQKNLDAENTKFQLGTEINQNVINAQQVLVQAQSAVVTNQIGVRLNLLNLLTQTGELLDERGIVVK
ncbi:MAG: TolC family protein [Acidobacteriia bacterium]|nr:TolC family protein [Terriglobia bacterium]